MPDVDAAAPFLRRQWCWLTSTGIHGMARQPSHREPIPSVCLWCTSSWDDWPELR